MKRVPEPNAELLSVDDIHLDVKILTSLLEKRRVERRSYEILQRPNVQDMLIKLIKDGECADEEEAIERALKTLITAVSK